METIRIASDGEIKQIKPVQRRWGGAIPVDKNGICWEAPLRLESGQACIFSVGYNPCADNTAVFCCINTLLTLLNLNGSRPQLELEEELLQKLTKHQLVELKSAYNLAEVKGRGGIK